MAWIHVIGSEEATGGLRRAYDSIGGNRTSNIRRVLSLHPQAMQASHAFSRSITFGGSALGRVREELIALVVSAELSCTY
jgi:alkylhydroperoxidase family enzyme